MDTREKIAEAIALLESEPVTRDKANAAIAILKEVLSKKPASAWSQIRMAKIINPGAASDR